MREMLTAILLLLPIVAYASPCDRYPNADLCRKIANSLGISESQMVAREQESQKYWSCERSVSTRIGQDMCKANHPNQDDYSMFWIK